VNNRAELRRRAFTLGPDLVVNRGFLVSGEGEDGPRHRRVRGTCISQWPLVPAGSRDLRREFLVLPELRIRTNIWHIRSARSGTLVNVARSWVPPRPGYWTAMQLMSLEKGFREGDVILHRTAGMRPQYRRNACSAIRLGRQRHPTGSSRSSEVVRVNAGQGHDEGRRRNP
jgi:hypothetical protein